MQAAAEIDESGDSLAVSALYCGVESFYSMAKTA